MVRVSVTVRVRGVRVRATTSMSNGPKRVPSRLCVRVRVRVGGVRVRVRVRVRGRGRGKHVERTQACG